MSLRHYIVLSVLYLCDYLLCCLLTLLSSSHTFSRSMRGFLQQRCISQTTGANFRPKLESCPGKSCKGECRQGVNCRGERPPPAKHHLLVSTRSLDISTTEKLCEINCTFPPSFFHSALNLFAKNSQSTTSQSNAL